jgi:hypothetical protein
LSDEYAAWLDEALGGMVRYHIQLAPGIARAYLSTFQGDPVALAWLAVAAAGSADARSTANAGGDATVTTDGPDIAPEQDPDDIETPADPAADLGWLTTDQTERLDTLTSERGDWRVWLATDLDERWGRWRENDAATLVEQMEVLLPVLVLPEEELLEVDEAAAVVADDFVAAALAQLSEAELADLDADDISAALDEWLEDQAAATDTVRN